MRHSGYFEVTLKTVPDRAGIQPSAISFIRREQSALTTV